MSEFDPYYFFLGIPPKEQPPNYYRLLGIELYEPSDEIISAAADRQMGHLQQHESGDHAEAVAEILSNVSRARICLLNREKKAAYDAELKKQLTPSEPNKPPKPVPTATSIPMAVPIRQPSPVQAAPLVTQQPQNTTPIIQLKGGGSVSERARQRPLPLLAIGIGSALVLLILCFLIFLPGRNGTIQIELDSKDKGVEVGNVRVEIDGEVIALAELEKPIELSADEHELRVEGPGIETATERFVVTRGENDKLVITLKRAVSPQVAPSKVEPDSQTNPDKVTTANPVEPKSSSLVEATETNSGRIANIAAGARFEVRAVATLAGHEDKVTCARFSTDGNMVISASADKTIRHWDVAEQRLVANLTGHTGEVSGVDISPDGRQAISSSSDATVRLWDLETQKEVRVLMGHNSYVRDIAFASDGKHALSGADGFGRGPNLFYWDLDGDEHKQWKASGVIPHVCISGDGKTALTTVYTGTDIRVWDVETGTIEGTFSQHKGRVTAVSLSGDGTLAASAASKSDKAYVWNVETKEVVIEGPVAWQAGISSDGRLVLQNLGSGKIGIWSVPDKNEVFSFQADPTSVKTLALAPSGTRFLTSGADNLIKIWDLVPADTKDQEDASTSTGSTDGSTLLSDDLSHWTVMATSGRDYDIHREGQGGWSVNNDMIRCDTLTNGWLRSNEQYGDFELSMEFKLPPGGNSGIYIRCPEQGHLSRVGMEVQVADDNAVQVTAETRTGAIHRAARNNYSVLKRAGQWNEIMIRCEGEQIRITLNGIKVVDVQMNEVEALRDRPRRGYIGLSNWQGQAKGTEFRSVRIRTLP